MTDWHEYEQDRLFAEAERKTAAQWAEYRAEKQRRLAEMDSRWPAPESVASALTMIAGLFCVASAILAFAGLLAALQ